jgi:HPt (histidine-containing phosphotransfer) domain-containing protein
MQSFINHKPFIFNKNIDSAFLFSLYENDFRYMEEIFTLSLEQVQKGIAPVGEALRKGETNLAGSLIHKIKPSFGFVGMTHAEQLCARFERACSEDIPFATDPEKIDPFLLALTEAEKTLKEELEKMKRYNLENNA